jgi:hypothetical protein
MIAMPKVVVAQIGDVASAGECQSLVVGPELSATVFRQIVPADARVIESQHHGFTVVSAGVADDNELEVLEGLRQHRHHGEAQHAAPIVGGDDDADGRRRGIAHHQPGLDSKR